jgi:hypothetical protein
MSQTAIVVAERSLSGVEHESVSLTSHKPAPKSGIRKAFAKVRSRFADVVEAVGSFGPPYHDDYGMIRIAVSLAGSCAAVLYNIARTEAHCLYYAFVRRQPSRRVQHTYTQHR